MKDHEYYNLIGDLTTAINKLQLAKPKIDFTWSTNPGKAVFVAKECGEAAKLILSIGEIALEEAKSSIYELPYDGHRTNLEID